MDKYTYSIGVVIMVKKGLIRSKRGVSLVYVMLVLIVMSILSVAIFTLFASNLRQAKFQEESIRAHFVAISGVEVAFAALTQDNQSLLKTYFDKPISTPVSPLSDIVEVEGGEANIIVSSFINTEQAARYIRITSTGHLEGTTTTKQVSMYFRIEYPEIQSWD